MRVIKTLLIFGLIGVLGLLFSACSKAPDHFRTHKKWQLTEMVERSADSCAEHLEAIKSNNVELDRLLGDLREVYARTEVSLEMCRKKAYRLGVKSTETARSMSMNGRSIVGVR